MSQPHHVVIVGGGFAELEAAKQLKCAPVDLTLLDRRNFYLFQALLYQVATGGLSPANIATPLRELLKRNKNTTVLLANVKDLETTSRRVVLDDCVMTYDTLIVAAGAIAELARTTLRNNFRHYDPATAKVLLVEGADRV